MCRKEKSKYQDFPSFFFFIDQIDLFMYLKNFILKNINNSPLGDNIIRH